MPEEQRSVRFDIVITIPVGRHPRLRELTSVMPSFEHHVSGFKNHVWSNVELITTESPILVKVRGPRIHIAERIPTSPNSLSFAHPVPTGCTECGLPFARDNQRRRSGTILFFKNYLTANHKWANRCNYGAGLRHH